MKTETLITVLLRLLGIFYLAKFIRILLSFLAIIPDYIKNESFTDFGYFYWGSMNILMYFIPMFFLLFQTGLIKRLFFRDLLADEDKLNIHRSVVYLTVVLVTGVSFLIKGLPWFLALIISQLSRGRKDPIIHYNSNIDGIIYFALGVFILLANKYIVNWLDYRRKKEKINHLDEKV
jgi:hypothetical protein